jgi:penicillin-binding protein 1A
VVLALVLALIGGVLYIWFMPFPAPHPTPQAAIIYDTKGHVLADFGVQNRVDVKLQQVPQVVVDAVVSTEDRHFFGEGGFDPIGIARAAGNDIAHPGSLQGGSTITQQYVKVAYLDSSRNVGRKFEELVLATRLSSQMSKRQILQNYLNVIYLGRGAYGIEAASRAYFNKDVGQLGLPEASLLASLIKDPSGADPSVDPKLASEAQRSTLKAMVRDHKITQAQADAVGKVPYSRYVLPLRTPNGTSADPTGTDYFLTAVRQELVAKYGERAVDAGGLRVTTTLDPTLQSDGYRAVYGSDPGSLNPKKGDPSGALVSVDDTGAVRALIGGQSYKDFSVDLALGKAGGGSGRQAGSTFKAFMLAEILQQGYSVNSVLPAPPRYEVPNGNPGGAPWVVTNYEGEAVAPKMNLVDATALSVNTVYAQLVQMIGANKLDAMAEKLGISKSEIPDAYPSQVLGTADVSPLEMAAAYSTFASGGIYHTPFIISKVTNANGKSLPLPISPGKRQVLSPKQAAIETYVLQQVVARGTGVAAGNVGSQVAGKTGTTEHSSDAWFVGYTPKLATALWMGYGTSTKSMDGFRGLASVTGGEIPAALWHNYMAAALKDEPAYGGAFGPAPDLNGRMLGATTTTTTSSSPSTTSTSLTTSTTSATTTTVPTSQPQPTAPPRPTTTLRPPRTTTTTSTTSTTSTTVPGG